MGVRSERYLERLPRTAVELDDEQAGAHLAATQRFLVCAANVIVAAGRVGEIGPMVDLAAEIEPNVRAAGADVEQVWMRCRSLPHATTQALAQGLHWETLADTSAEWAAMESPYEALLELVDMGGYFSVEQRILKLASGDRPMLRIDAASVLRRATRS